MYFYSKVLEIPVTVEQDAYENLLVSVLVHIVPDSFASYVIEQKRSLGIVSDNFVLVAFGIAFIHYFLGTNDEKPKCLEPILLGHVTFPSVFGKTVYLLKQDFRVPVHLRVHK